MSSITTCPFRTIAPDIMAAVCLVNTGHTMHIHTVIRVIYKSTRGVSRPRANIDQGTSVRRATRWGITSDLWPSSRHLFGLINYRIHICEKLNRLSASYEDIIVRVGAYRLLTSLSLYCHLIYGARYVMRQ